MVVTGTSFVHREGNGHADAAAKAALEFHDVDFVAVEAARKLKAIVQLIGKFLVHMQLVVAKAKDDAPALDRRTKAAKTKASVERAAGLHSRVCRHTPVQVQGGVRCLWCYRKASDNSHLCR